MPVFPTVYDVEAKHTPDDVFRQHEEYLHNDKVPSEILIYTDGACLENSVDGARRGGCGFVISHGDNGAKFFALEDYGDDGYYYRHSINRAEVRAVTGALRYMEQENLDGISSIVIATDSEFVTLGATCWIQEWSGNG